jgi:hypothetical protein
MARTERREAKHRAASRKIDALLQHAARLIAENAKDTLVLKAEMRAFIKARAL